MNKNASASFGSWAKIVITGVAIRNRHRTKGKPEHGGGRNNSQKHVSHHLPVGLRTATVGTVGITVLFSFFPLSQVTTSQWTVPLSLSAIFYALHWKLWEKKQKVALHQHTSYTHAHWHMPPHYKGTGSTHISETVLTCRNQQALTANFWNTSLKWYVLFSFSQRRQSSLQNSSQSWIHCHMQATGHQSLYGAWEARLWLCCELQHWSTISVKGKKCLTGRKNW